LTHSFRGFSPWSLGPVALGLWQHGTSWWEYMAEEVCSPHGDWEAKKEKQEGAGITVFPIDLTSSHEALACEGSTTSQ
jgi:hypothetical protein